MSKWDIDRQKLLKKLLNPLFMLGWAYLCFSTYASAQGAGQGNAQAPFASGTTQFNHNGIDPRSISDPNFNKCDHNCLYNKANENITLQVDYILRKHQYINDDRIDEQDRRAVLGGFCRQANPAGASGAAGVEEDFDECRKRWNTLNNFWLLKAQTSLSKNEGSKAELAGMTCKGDKCDPASRTDYFKEGGRFSADYFYSGQQNANSTKYSQAPAFSKANDLALHAKSAYEKLQQVSDMSDDQLAKALAESLEPKEEDFIEFIRVQRDPTNGGSEYFEIPRRTPDGKPVYNMKAYQLALKKYEATFGKMKNTGNTKGTLLEDTFVGRPNSIKDQRIQNLKKMETEFKEPATSTNKSETRQMYDDARDRYVEDIRKQMGQPTSVSFPGNKQNQRSVSTGNSGSGPSSAPGQSAKPPYDGTLDVPYQQVQQTTDSQGNTTTSSQDTSMALHATQFNFVPEGQSSSNGISIRPPVRPSGTPTTGPMNVNSSPISGPGSATHRSSQQQQKLQQVQDHGSINLDFN